MRDRGPGIRRLLFPDAPAQKQGRGRPLLVVLVVVAGVGAALAAGALLIGTTQDFGQRGQEAAAADGPGALDFVDARIELIGSQEFVITAGPAIGGADLRGIDLLVSVDGAEAVRYAFSDAPDRYHVEVLRDANGSITPSSPVLDRGDLVTLRILPEDQGITLGPGQTVTVVQDHDGDVLGMDVFQVPGGRFAGIVALDLS